MHNTAQQQYLKVKVETASPGELTLLLFQEMVKSLLQAKQLYSQHQYENMNDNLHKARSILNELIVTLNYEYDIAKDLGDLYLFYNQHIAKFVIKRDVRILDEIIEFAKGMADTWKQVLLLVKTGGK